MTTNRRRSSVRFDLKSDKSKESLIQPNIYGSDTNIPKILENAKNKIEKIKNFPIKKFCEQSKAKKVCANIPVITERLDLDDIPFEENEPEWKKLFRENFVVRPKKYHTEKAFQSSSSSSSDDEITNLNHFLSLDVQNDPPEDLVIEKKVQKTILKGKMNWDSEKPSDWTPYDDGRYERPFTIPPNEVNFLGGLGDNIGNPRSKVHIERPTPVQIIYNMRTRNNPVFTFGEDPKIANCCVRPMIEADPRNTGLIKHLVEQVKMADNQETPTPSEYSDDPTEIFDPENPLNMDFQGLDYKETYRRDEQEQQNKKEYYIQKRVLDKIQLNKTAVKQMKDAERQKKYGLPDYFNINDDDFFDDNTETKSIDSYATNIEQIFPAVNRPAPDTVPYVPDNAKMAQLIRTTNKLSNINKIEEAIERRRSKIEERVDRKNQKLNEMERKLSEQKKIDDENFVLNLGEKDFEDYFKDEYKEILDKWKSLPDVYKERKYPHTMRELHYLKRKLNHEKRLVRNKARIKTDFLKEIGKQKTIEEVNLNVDELSNDAVEVSEQSSDDEDGLSIGRRSDNKFQLRGFHYILDREPRGKINIKKMERLKRGCITRKEWFSSLAPESAPPVFFKNCPSSIPSKAEPTEDDYIIFERLKIKPKPIKISPIREIIENPPESPKILNPKEPKLKKPIYTKVKKFNLTGYLYGTSKREKLKPSKYGHGDNKYGIPYEMIEKSDALFEEKENRKRQNRYKRMIKMGLPIEDHKKIDKLETIMEDESEDSGVDWLPEEEIVNEIDYNNMNVSNVNLTQSNHYPNSISEFVEKTKSISITNMRAPSFRQPTLRHHPRRKRKQSIIGITTSIINSKYPKNKENLNESNDNREINYNVPRLSKLDSDIIVPSNLNEVKKDYVHLFNARHHHDHKNPTQHKIVYVKYTPKVPKFKEIQSTNKEGKTNDKITDITKPSFEYIAEERQENVIDQNKKSKIKITYPKCEPIKTRKNYENNLPGKQKYKKFIKSKNQEMKNIFNYSADNKVQSEICDPNEYIQELKRDEDSIKSCYTSDTSSVGTNFTNDSGSYFMLQNKKVPVDYLTKCYVPFEEIDRGRLKSCKLKKMDEYYGPYYTTPFSGQQQEMRKITAPTDKFYTNLVRSRYGIRNRLQVILPSFDDELIGKKNAKFLSCLATEWDEYYQNEIKNRPRVKRFKPKTIITQSRNALRRKFTSYYIKEFVTQLKMKDKKEKLFADEVIKFEEICNPLFIKWEEKFYRGSMRKMQALKPYFIKTALLKKEVNELRKLSIKLNMSIVYVEDDWFRTIIFQNFHYLIHDMKWREENDWIHRQSDGQLENYRISIANRYTVNIRVRDKDDAWAVKEFYENHFLKNYHEPMIIFTDTNSFKRGLVKLKMISFMCLVQLHFTMWILINLEHGLSSFKLWSSNYLEKRTKYVKNRCSKKYFMEERLDNITMIGNEIINEPIENVINSETRTLIIPLCETIFQYFIPEHVRCSMDDSTIIDKFTLITDLLINLLGELDLLPRIITKQAEIDVRKKKAFEYRQAERSCALESRIDFVMAEMKRNLKPPKPKEKRIGKLPRSYLPPKIKKIRDTKIKISDEKKLFFDAFTEKENIEFETKENMQILKNLENNCIPFYYDHFLKLHDYFPVYDFKTKIELIDGPEENLFNYKMELDNVYELLKQWEKKKQEEMEYHIKRTWYLYIEEPPSNIIPL